MGNVLGLHNLNEKLCESCYDDHQTSLSVGSEALPEVAERGHVHCLRALIEARAPRVKAEEQQDVFTSALTSAAQNGHLDCMQVLVEAGADVNQSESLFHSPLTLAAERGQNEALKFLIEKGADVNAINRMYTALARAAMYGQYDCVHTLLKAEANVNVLVNMGYTALMYAAQSGSYPCVRLLIQAGADVNLRNIDGNTAISSAANGTRTNVTSSDESNRKLILDISRGGDVNAEDNEIDIKNVPNSANRIECVKLLLQSGAKINLVNKNSVNALVSYVRSCKDQNKLPERTMVLLLFAAGEKLDGITPCSVADYLEKREICLKSICRQTIRIHLLDVDPHAHLFGRVPRLGLPPSLSDYVLYGHCLINGNSSD